MRFAIMIISAFAMVLGILAPIPAQAKAGPGCEALERSVQQASAAGKTAQAIALFKQAESSGLCSGLALSLIGRNVAFAHYRKAFSGPQSDRQRAELIRAGLHYGRPWQMLAWLGDFEKARKNYTQAAMLYGEALDDTQDKVFHPKPVLPEVVKAIRQKAIIASQLSKTYVPRRDKSGGPGGLARMSWRGFTTRKVPVPVQFEFRTTRFTKKGKAAVRDMLGYLEAQRSPDIKLIGHTDERGPQAFNQRLSLARAKAVKDWLAAQGYQGRITIEGRGEDEPFAADDRGSYTEEERWQLDRRVELVR